MSPETPTEICWNVDFDLGLRPGAAPLDPAHLLLVEELSLHPWMAALTGDTLRAKRLFPDDFVGYLASKGLPCPRVVLEPAITPASRLRPFGWNRAMAALAELYDHPMIHPAPEVVARVNGRTFARELESSLGVSLPGGVVHDVTSLTKLLRGHPWPHGGWVLKEEHGHSGMGLVRLASPDLVPRRLEALSSPTSGPWILEPWLERTLDLSLSFRLDPTGRLDDLELHESLVTSRGSFLGLWLDPAASWRPTWGRQLEDCAAPLADALTRERYHGPVGIDAFLAGGSHHDPMTTTAPPRNDSLGHLAPGTRDDIGRQFFLRGTGDDSGGHLPAAGADRTPTGRPDGLPGPGDPGGSLTDDAAGWLRPLSDLNARESMTGPIRTFRRRHLADRVVHWRYFSPRRMRLPATISDWCRGFGADDYDPATRTGVLLTSPLESIRDGILIPTRKLGVLFTAPDRPAVEALLTRFRQAFERDRS